MKRFSRRTVLASSAIGGLSLAGCLGTSERKRSGNGTDNETDNETDGDADGSNRESASDAIDEIVWTSEPGGRAVTVHDDTLYGIEDFTTGSGSVVALEAASGDRKWSYGETGGYTAYTNPVVGDAIYFGYGDDAVGSGDGKLYALEFDGTERFTAQTGSIYDPPRLADGAVFVGSDDGRVYAFESDDGSERWTVRFAADDAPRTPTVELVADGLAYVTVAGTIRAIDVETGAERWRYETSDGRVRSVARGDDGIAFATYGEVGVVDDGEERWTVALDSGNRLGDVVDGTVIVVRGTDIVAFDATDGTERWRDEHESERRIWVTDDAIYAGSTTLRCATLEGDEQWTVELEGGEIDAIRIDGDTVYAATDAAVHRVDREDGELDSSIPLEGVGSLVVADRLYAGTREAFYGIEL